MPQIPVVRGPNSVADERAPSVGPALVQPNVAAASALGDVGNSVARGGAAAAAGLSAADRQYEQAQKEARAVVEADAMVAFGTKADQQLAAIRQQRGLAASEMSSTTLDAIDKARADIEADISDPRARAQFRVNSSDMLLTYRRQVESHVGKEFGVAQDETAKARAGQVLAMAEAGVVDFDSYKETVDLADQNLRALAPSPVAGDAAVQKLRSDAGAAFVGGMLAQGRIEDAATFVDQNRGELGSRYVEAKSAVTRAQAGAAKDVRSLEAAGAVDRAAQRVTTPDGYVTEGALREALSPEGNALPEDIEEALQKRVRIEDRKFKVDVDKANKDLLRAENDGLPIPGVTRDYLQKYDPDALLAYRGRQRALADRARALRNGNASDRAAAQREQNEADEAYRWRLTRELRLNPAVDPAEVEKNFTADYAKKGRSVTISDAERERAGAVSVEAQQKAETREGQADKAAATRIEKVLTLATRKQLKRGEKIDPTTLNAEVGRDLLIYDELVRQKGKPLSEDEWADFESNITGQQAVERPGRFFGTNTTQTGRLGQQPTYGPAAPSAAAPPAVTTPPAGGETRRDKNGVLRQRGSDGKWYPVEG